MLLYVIRHAIAVDPTPDVPDAERHLTADGAKRMKRAVKGMRALGWRFDRVITSPWRRAWETAELLAPLAEDDAIPSDLLVQTPRAELLAMIAENAGGTTTAVVGHEPWLGELVAWLAFGDTRHGEALRIKKGSVAMLSGTAVPGGMEIRGIVPPAVLRALSA